MQDDADAPVARALRTVADEPPVTQAAPQRQSRDHGEDEAVECRRPGAGLNIAHAQFGKDEEAGDQRQLGKQGQRNHPLARMRSVTGVMIR